MIEEKTKKESGQLTGKIDKRTIGPEVDISKESEYVQGIVNAARIGYIKPVQEV